MNQLFERDTYDEDALFWIVVQACQDIVYYPSERCHNKADFLHAYEWIVDGETQEVLGKDMTFSDALEALGVNPDNIAILRYAVMRSPQSQRAWKKTLVQEAYKNLDIPANEITPWWRMITNFIVNKEPEY